MRQRPVRRQPQSKISRKNNAHQRSCKRHQQFGPGARRLIFKFRDTTQEPKRNALDFNAISPPDQGVGKLVKNNRQKEPENTSDPHPPIGGHRQTLIDGRKIALRERPGDQESNERPAHIDFDFKAKNFKQSDISCKHCFSSALDFSYPSGFTLQKRSSHVNDLGQIEPIGGDRVK